MQFYQVRNELACGKNITNIPLKVTFYARVSTESDEQLNSLDNQISYFKNLIEENINWTYVDGYIDEGISGSSVKKRKNFLRMMDDAKKGCFDLILTKEVSRFSRNLADSIKYTQELSANNVGVLFQSNGINTYDPNSEFILNMMGSVAQEEVKRLSERVKWGHKESIKKGRVLGNNSITGYRKNNGTLIIDEQEVEKVRSIFSLYATGKYGLTKLGEKLYSLGIKNSRGNVYDKDTLKRIIQNPKYKGFYRGHTTEVIDYRTKQRVKIPVEKQVIYEDEQIPQLVAKELWEKANKILNKRSIMMKNSNGNAKKINQKYAYTSKIYCYEHKITFQRKIDLRKKAKWSCANYIRKGIKSCQSPIIFEEDLDIIFKKIFKEIFKRQVEIIDEIIELYIKVNNDNDYDNQIEKITDEINLLQIKKEKILELNITNNLSNIEFQNKNDLYNEKIGKLNKQIEELNYEKKYHNNEEYITKIKEKIIDILSFDNEIDNFIEEFLNKIVVSKIDNDRNYIKLDIYMRMTDEEIALNEASYKGDKLIPVINGNYQSNRNQYVYCVYFE